MGETHWTWWDAVRQLPASHRFVIHEPETPRYARARQKLGYVLREGEYLGASRKPDRGQIEIAVWAPTHQGRGPGYYCCFRLFIEEGMVTDAALFCFYDGTESSPALSTLRDAQAVARENGFVREIEDGNQD